MKVFRYLIKIAPFLYAALIWYLSGRPTDAVIQFNRADALIKESLHVVEFAILYSLIVLSLLVDGRLSKGRNRLAAVVSVLYGLIDEIHQSFVPYRSATVIDFVKDATGVVVLYIFVFRGYFLEKNRLGMWLRSFENLFK